MKCIPTHMYHDDEVDDEDDDESDERYLVMKFI